MNFTQPRKKLFNISSQVLVRRWKEKRHREAWERRAWGGENIQTHSKNVLSNMIQLKPLLRDGKQAPYMLHIGNTWSNDSPCSPPTLRRDKLSLNVSHSPSGNDVRARPASTHRATKFFKSSITKDKHSDTYADRRHWASRPCCRTTQIPFERGSSAARHNKEKRTMKRLSFSVQVLLLWMFSLVISGGDICFPLFLHTQRMISAEQLSVYVSTELGLCWQGFLDELVGINYDIKAFGNPRTEELSVWAFTSRNFGVSLNLSHILCLLRISYHWVLECTVKCRLPSFHTSLEVLNELQVTTIYYGMYLIQIHLLIFMTFSHTRLHSRRTCAWLRTLKLRLFPFVSPVAGRSFHSLQKRCCVVRKKRDFNYRNLLQNWSEALQIGRH